MVDEVKKGATKPEERSVAAQSTATPPVIDNTDQLANYRLSGDLNSNIKEAAKFVGAVDDIEKLIRYSRRYKDDIRAADGGNGATNPNSLSEQQTREALAYQKFLEMQKEPLMVHSVTGKYDFLELLNDSKRKPYIRANILEDLVGRPDILTDARLRFGSLKSYARDVNALEGDNIVPRKIAPGELKWLKKEYPATQPELEKIDPNGTMDPLDTLRKFSNLPRKPEATDKTLNKQ